LGGSLEKAIEFDEILWILSLSIFPPSPEGGLMIIPRYGVAVLGPALAVALLSAVTSAI
jgi:hypothetical protein